MPNPTVYGLHRYELMTSTMAGGESLVCLRLITDAEEVLDFPMVAEAAAELGAAISCTADSCLSSA